MPGPESLSTPAASLPGVDPAAVGTPSPRPPAAVASPEAPRHAAAAKRRFRRRVALAAGFILVAISTAAVLIALALTQEDPRWWTRVDPADPRTIETAEAVENGIATALTQVRGGGPAGGHSAGGAAPSGPPAAPAPANQPWRVYVTAEQANAWLNVRLQRWLADQTEQGVIDFEWPQAVKQVQVSFDDGRIHVGAKVERPGTGSTPRPQTLGASLRPQFGRDGSLWLVAEHVEIGRLPVPAGWVLGSASGAGTKKVGDVSDELAKSPETQKVIEAFKGERPVLSRPVIKLADGRRVRLLSIEPRDGKLVITAQTEVREPARP